ncbi:hypothetical protein L4X63_08770 [Geomonas sp. Red32]|uniref:hypothetical protein n=1 Tax=Geomonas sp. Red32 TaxID=2912856 RepID=UPI00202CB86E|nr:hypothetical protein [Geomonas sp. Red32]MCM0081678.1 hypothetical protein [Geomonas sp. Red32]
MGIGTRISLAAAVLMTAMLPGAPGNAGAATSAAQLQASAVIAPSKGTCTFDTGGPYAIAFPTINPLAATPLTATVTFTVTCTGLTGSGGKTVIVETATSNQLYLTNGSDRIPYSLSLPSSQAATNKKPTSFTVTATIAASAYVTAPAGAYSDSVLIDILP